MHRLEMIEERIGAAKQWHLIATLAALAAVTLVLGSWGLAFVGPDEPRYGEVAREMFVSGDYITPRIAGCTWLEKPPLFYWLAAMGYGLLGVSEFATRLPSLLGALLITAFARFALKHRGYARLANATAVVTLTMGIVIGFARAASMDMLFTCTIALALLSYYLFLGAEGRERTVWWVLFAAGIGLSVLAKGLAGVVLIVAISGIHMLVSRGFRRITQSEILIGLSIVVVVSGAWYLPMVARHGREFIDDFIIAHHFRRYVSNEFRHPQPIYFYPFILLAGAIPWTFYFVPALRRLRDLRGWLSEPGSPMVLAWLWVLVPLIFFSFSQSKLPGYLLPVFPAAAVILGSEVVRVWRDEPGWLLRAAGWLTVLLLLGLAIALPIYLRRLEAGGGALLILELLPVLAAMACIGALAAGLCRVFVVGVATTVATLVLATVIVLLPVLSERLSLKTLSLRAAEALEPGERIAFFSMKEFAPVFYAEGRVVCSKGEGTVLNALSTDRLALQLETEQSLIVFTEAKWLPTIESDPRFDIVSIGSQRDAVAVRLSLRRDIQAETQ